MRQWSGIGRAWRAGEACMMMLMIDSVLAFYDLWCSVALRDGQ